MGRTMHAGFAHGACANCRWKDHISQCHFFNEQEPPFVPPATHTAIVPRHAPVIELSDDEEGTEANPITIM